MALSYLENTTTSDEIDGANMLITGIRTYMHTYMSIVRHISAWGIEWDTDLEVIHKANGEQIQAIIDEKGKLQ